ncbi:hypothetical protein HMPREF3034_00010 [Prevotella sp. DNF00663]|uniref:hypothetical protein n=1 Tax=Prevotella sp. DNF00663 TaxID=1384078 RepID=UPI0007957E78|nr:hypothetical protein [Prevotella sp. DNF00663]KXB86062.1 hypothetical protein HMPREF3034_00010 [Prevotella sp. DNF00663]
MMEQTQPNRQYFNDAQLYTLTMNTRDEVIVAGRGLGKGAIQARRAQSCVQGMPGSMGGFVAPSVKRCLTNILPSMLIHLERWGFKRDLHYVVGKKPWKKLHWKNPIFTPANWENTISFYNGSVINVISQDRSGTSNSMSLDYLIIDEAKFIDFEQLKDETFQANRGNEMYFRDFPLHHGMTITSDMPITKKGSWFLSYKEKMDPELVEVIEGLVFQLWKLRKKRLKHPGNSIQIDEQIGKLQQKLSFFRSQCLLYKEYSSIENLALLGEEFIRRAKRDLPPLTFATSIMCRHIGISADGFYGGMREDVNLYTAPNENVLNLHNLDKDNMPDDCRMDSDLIGDAPLCIAFDANANINWLVVGQVGFDFKLRVLKSFFVKYERKLPELLEDFMSYYRYHRRKQVIFYYDATFVGNNYALHNNDFHKEIEKTLKLHQWNVRAVYIGQPMSHIDKNALINRMFRGRANHMILINRDNNPDLLISITSAGVYNGKKDKRGEKLAETEEDKLEARTDGSDAFDTLCIGVERFPVMQIRGITTNSYSK